jgi:hypothetical protein
MNIRFFNSQHMLHGNENMKSIQKGFRAALFGVYFWELNAQNLKENLYYLT